MTHMPLCVTMLPCSFVFADAPSTRSVIRVRCKSLLATLAVSVADMSGRRRKVQSSWKHLVQSIPLSQWEGVDYSALCGGSCHPLITLALSGVKVRLCYALRRHHHGLTVAARLVLCAVFARVDGGQLGDHCDVVGAACRGPVARPREWMEPQNAGAAVPEAVLQPSVDGLLDCSVPGGDDDESSSPRRHVA